MANSFGNIAAFFRLRFNEDEVARLERVVSDHINAAGVPDASDYFRSSMQGLDRETRERLLHERMRAMGIPADPLKDLPDAFRVIKEPTVREGGYGVINMPRTTFVGRGPEDIEAMTRQLAAVSTSVNLTGFSDDPVRLTKSAPTIQAVRNAATQATMAEEILGSTRVVFDVETGGLSDEAGIWQVSARKIGPDGKEIGSITRRFRNNAMDLGDYTLSDAPGTAGMNAEEFITSKRPDLPITERFDEGIKEFFDFLTADDVDYISAHNLPFDVRQLAVNTDDIGRNIPGFAESRQKFLSMAESTKGIDTRMLAFMLMENEGKLVGISKDSSQTALENLLTQTSLQKDMYREMVEQGVASNASEAADEFQRWLGKGMHFSDVDVFFESHLLTLELKALSGKSGIMRPDASMDPDTAKRILDEGAITPYTDILEHPEFGKLTPVQLGALNRRNLTNFTGDVTVAQLREAGGTYGRWFDDITAGSTHGGIKKGVGLMRSAVDEIPNMPFSGLSPVERLITTAMGQTGLKAGGEINRVRRLAGAELGVGMFEFSRKAKVYGGRNVALPIDLLQQIETEAPHLMRSNFTGALTDDIDAVQTVRPSTITYRLEDGKGAIRKDIALVADIFEDQKQAEEFAGYISENAKRLGISADVVTEIGEAARTGKMQRYGVQVGTMGTGAQGVDQLHTILEQLTMGLDDSNVGVRMPLMSAPQAVENIVTGHAESVARYAADPDSAAKPRRIGMLGAAQIEGVGEMDPEVTLSNLRGARRATSLAATELPGNRELGDRLVAARQMGTSDAPRPLYNFLEKNLHHVNPMNVGIGLAAVGTYYLFGKHKEQQAYDETTDFAGYEDPGFYENYKSEMGEPVQANYQQRHLDTLATARTVQSLDANKIRHHQMSSSGRNSHLYGGAL